MCQTDPVSAMTPGFRRLPLVFPVASTFPCYLALDPGMLVPGVNSTVICHRANAVSSIEETPDAGLSTGAALKTIWPTCHFIKWLSAGAILLYPYITLIRQLYNWHSKTRPPRR